MSDNATREVMAAALFAARKHQAQRRKDIEATPYINHPLAVAELLTRIAGVTDVVTLQAALLHDTIEDTGTLGREVEASFGTEVHRLVEEMTDDKSLPKEVRKRLQIEHAPELSPPARLIKLADKICNVGDFTVDSPAGWPVATKRDYLNWAEQVVNKIRGTNTALEKLFDETLVEKRKLFG